MLAVIVLRFDPYIEIAGLTVPWRAVGIAVAVLVALALAARLARRSEELRLDDLLYLVVAAIPGAIVGGRLVYGLAYLDVYAADPGQLLDASRGGLSLLGAVLGGVATAVLVARLLETPVRAWASVAAAPLLLAIGLGKLALLLGGGGQGLPSDAPWAVAFEGPGPWLSTRADLPAHPAQAYEGLWALLGVPVALTLGTWSHWRRWWVGEGYGPSGRSPTVRPLGYGPRTGLAAEPAPAGSAAGYLLGAALAWWLAGRFVAGFTWRDERGFGPLAAEQALALVTLGVLLVLAVLANRAERRLVVAEPPPSVPSVASGPLGSPAGAPLASTSNAPLASSSASLAPSAGGPLDVAPAAAVPPTAERSPSEDRS